MIQFTTDDRWGKLQYHYIDPNAVSYIHIHEDETAKNQDKYTLKLIVAGYPVVYTGMTSHDTAAIRQLILDNQS